MSRSNPNPFFECEYAVMLETRRKQRTIHSREIDAQKRQDRLIRRGVANLKATAEAHNGVTTIVIRELE